MYINRKDLLFSLFITIILTNVLTYFPTAANAKKDVSVITETSWGLHKATFQTPHGKIKVNLPDDMSAGDTLSGTVIAEPAGETQREIERNSDELNGYVVEVQEKKTSVAGKYLKWTVPPALAGGVATLILTDDKGKEIARTGVPVMDTPPAIDRPTVPTPEDFHLPRIGQAGRPIEVHGPFDGNIETTGLKIGNQPVESLAESPRKFVALSPRDIVGPTEIELREGDVVAKGTMNNLKIRLSADKTKLLKGETTTLGVNVSGLQGIGEPATINLINDTPEVVSMDGGDFQTMTIWPEDVGEDGSYISTRTITGIKTGGFNILAQAQDCEHVVVEEEIEWGDWHVEKDGTKWRKGTLYRVYRCADERAPHEATKEKIGTVRETVKRSGRSTVVTQRDKNGKTEVTREEKDTRGRTTETTTSQYDNGNVKKVTEKDKRGKTTEWEYDDEGNVERVKETDARGKTTEWKKEDDSWYKKKGDKWIRKSKGPKGPENVPEKLN